VQISKKDGKLSFMVRVQPRASRDEIVGEYQGGLRIRLAAPPLDDRANEALRKPLSIRLNVPLAAVKIAAGGRSRTKRIEIAGVMPEAIVALLG
jgi:uncharacterized protein